MDELASMQPLYEKYHLKILSCHLFADLEDELLPGKILRLCEDFGITQFVIAGIRKPQGRAALPMRKN